VVRNGNGRAYSLNVIDTPGLSEIRATLADRRTNEQLISHVQDFLSASVTHLSAVFFVLPLGTLTEEDVQILSTMRSLLGDEFKKHTYLVFSHAEQHQLATLIARAKEFVSSEVSLPFLDFCQGGILFSGAINGELCSELGQEFQKLTLKKVTSLRHSLLEAAMGQLDRRLDFTVSHESTKKDFYAAPNTPKKSTQDAKVSPK